MITLKISLLVEQYSNITKYFILEGNDNFPYLNFGIDIKLYKSSPVRNRRHNDAGGSKSYVRALSIRVSSRAYNSVIKFTISVDLLRATDYAT